MRHPDARTLDRMMSAKSDKLRLELLLPLSAAAYFLLRLLYLDADPVPMDFSFSAFGDIGYYSMNARSAARFDTWTECLWFVTPLFPGYHVPLAAWFRLVGDSYESLRLFHILAHFIGAASCVFAAHRTWGAKAASWTAFFWSVAWVSVAGSRNGWVENILIGYIGLAFLASTFAVSTGGAAILGLMTGLVVLAKPYALVIALGGTLGAGRCLKKQAAFFLSFGTVLAFFAFLLWTFHGSMPDAWNNTMGGTFVGREKTTIGTLILRAILRGHEIFATNFFARIPLETALACFGFASLGWGRKEWKPGERFLAGGAAGMVVLFLTLHDYRSIRYYLVFLPFWLTSAGFAAAAGADQWSALLRPVGMARRTLLFAALTAIALPFIRFLSSSAFDANLPSPLWLLLALALAAMACFAIRRIAGFLTARSWILLALILPLATGLAQYTRWWQSRTSDIADVSRALRTAHPPGRVFGWLSPTLALGTPHRVYWDWGKPDDPSYYVAKYQCDYWWKNDTAPIAALQGRLIADFPIHLPGKAQRVYVYRMGDTAL